MSASRHLVTLFASYFLLAGTSVVLAEPGNGRGDKPSAHVRQESHTGHGRSDQYRARGQDERGGRHEQGREHAGHPGYRGDYRYPGWVDESRIRRVFDDNRGYWSPGRALPSGVQMRLARGRPLPPGIAKQLNARLYGRLPYYYGYEWMRVGTELILVDMATQVIHEVVHDVFR